MSYNKEKRYLIIMSKVFFLTVFSGLVFLLINVKPAQAAQLKIGWEVVNERNIQNYQIVEYNLSIGERFFINTPEGNTKRYDEDDEDENPELTYLPANYDYLVFDAPTEQGNYKYEVVIVPTAEWRRQRISARERISQDIPHTEIEVDSAGNVEIIQGTADDTLPVLAGFKMGNVGREGVVKTDDSTLNIFWTAYDSSDANVNFNIYLIPQYSFSWPDPEFYNYPISHAHRLVDSISTLSSQETRSRQITINSIDFPPGVYFAGAAVVDQAGNITTDQYGGTERNEKYGPIKILFMMPSGLEFSRDGNTIDWGLSGRASAIANSKIELWRWDGRQWQLLNTASGQSNGSLASAGDYQYGIHIVMPNGTYATEQDYGLDVTAKPAGVAFPPPSDLNSVSKLEADNPYIKNTCYVYPDTVATDYCRDEDHLVEYSCVNGAFQEEVINCPCRVGAGKCEDEKIMYWSSPLFDDKIYFFGEGFNSNHKLYVLTSENPDKFTKVDLIISGMMMYAVIEPEVNIVLRDNQLIGYITEDTPSGISKKDKTLKIAIAGNSPTSSEGVDLSGLSIKTDFPCESVELWRKISSEKLLEYLQAQKDGLSAGKKAANFLFDVFDPDEARNELFSALKIGEWAGNEKKFIFKLENKCGDLQEGGRSLQVVYNTIREKYSPYASLLALLEIEIVIEKTNNPDMCTVKSMSVNIEGRRCKAGEKNYFLLFNGSIFAEKYQDEGRTIINSEADGEFKDFDVCYNMSKRKSGVIGEGISNYGGNVEYISKHITANVDTNNKSIFKANYDKRLDENCGIFENYLNADISIDLPARTGSFNLEFATENSDDKVCNSVRRPTKDQPKLQYYYTSREEAKKEIRGNLAGIGSRIGNIGANMGTGFGLTLPEETLEKMATDLYHQVAALKDLLDFEQIKNQVYDSVIYFDPADKANNESLGINYENECVGLTNVERIKNPENQSDYLNELDEEIRSSFLRNPEQSPFTRAELATCNNEEVLITEISDGSLAGGFLNIERDNLSYDADEAIRKMRLYRESCAQTPARPTLDDSRLKEVGRNDWIPYK